jgi:hypothetical protein
LDLGQTQQNAGAETRQMNSAQEALSFAPVSGHFFLL